MTTVGYHFLSYTHAIVIVCDELVVCELVCDDKVINDPRKKLFINFHRMNFHIHAIATEQFFDDPQIELAFLFLAAGSSSSRRSICSRRLDLEL